MSVKTRDSSPKGWITPSVVRRCLTPLRHVLQTGDPSSSMDRLFTSQHVKDLQLIIAVGLIAVIAVFVGSLGASAWSQATLLGQGEYRNFLFGVMGGFLKGNFTKLCAPVLAAYGAIFAWAYQAANTRLGVVDLFACEISTLCRVAIVVRTVHRYVERLNHPPSPDSSGAGAPTPQGSVSQENYFPVFENNTGALQALEARVVIDITAFYTYMKAVRDIQRMLSNMPPPAVTEAPPRELSGETSSAPDGSWRYVMRNLIYMLFLAMESARHSIDHLVEFEPEKAERTVMILLSELEAFRCLRGEFRNDGDIYHERIELRIPEYKETLDELRSDIQAGMHAAADSADWKKADLLRPELERLAEAALKTSALSASA